MFNRCLIVILLALAVLGRTKIKKPCGKRFLLKPEVTSAVSPNYPDHYPTGLSCKYTFTVIPNYDFKVNCSIRMPSNNDKNPDIFYLESKENPQMPRRLDFYGFRKVSPNIYFKNLVVGFLSKGQQGGKFKCTFRTRKLKKKSLSVV